MSQAELFAPEPVAPKPAPSYGMPASVRRKHMLAQSPEVLAAAMAIFLARPGEWLKWSAFRSVIDRFDISCCFGRVLTSLAHQGDIEERKVYFGRGIDAERPGSPTYQGFGHEYRLAVKLQGKET